MLDLLDLVVGLVTVSKSSLTGNSTVISSPDESADGLRPMRLSGDDGADAFDDVIVQVTFR